MMGNVPRYLDFPLRKNDGIGYVHSKHQARQQKARPTKTTAPVTFFQLQFLIEQETIGSTVPGSLGLWEIRGFLEGEY